MLCYLIHQHIETVGHIIKAKFDALIKFGEEQGISSEKLIDIVFQRNAKKTVDIPVNAVLLFNSIKVTVQDLGQN